MSKKVEEYIENYTKRCSNEDGFDYVPWLTPDNARNVAQIAREEVIEKAVEWIKNDAVKYCTVRFEERNIPKPSYLFSEIMEKDFRKAMEEKV